MSGRRTGGRMAEPCGRGIAPYLAAERSDRAEYRRLDLQALLGVAVLRDLGL